MSAKGLDVFDKTLQTTHIWLDQIMKELGCDRQMAWHALGAVLRPLRDRLTVEQGAHLAAQLPLLIRGLYYDQWHPSGTPERIRHQHDLLARVADGLSDVRPVNPRDTARLVLKVLAAHVSRGQIDKVKEALPLEIRALFPDGPAQSAA